jgi:DHA2 family multidrug resistance protein-like MFS transporter
MSRQWMTLMAILLVYIPVAIDATVLHVAAPTLSVALGSSGNELLWIIDIYSLVMAGMVLPMGALAIRSALSACCCSAAPFLASRRCAPRCRRRL